MSETGKDKVPEVRGETHETLSEDFDHPDPDVPNGVGCSRRSRAWPRNRR